MSVLGNFLGTNTKESKMTTYTQDQIGTLKSAISVATIELRAAWDLLAAPSTSQIDMGVFIDELTHTAACYHDYSSLRQRIADVVSAHIKGGA